MQPLIFHFKTLTPLWLGGHDGDSKRTKESGLVGSMRFWYEGMLRRACSPESECPKLFGSTGFRRSFHVRAEGLKTISLDEYNRERKSKLGPWLGKHKHALFADDELIITITPHFGKESLVSERVPFLLQSMSELGAIGAKTQHGFGQVQLLNEDDFRDDIATGVAALQAGSGVQADEFFTLHETRFYTGLWEGEALPDKLAQNLPAAVRRAVAQVLAPGEEADIVLGCVPQGRGHPARGTRIHVTIPYQETGKWRVKVWFDSKHRAAILGAVEKYMKGAFPGWQHQKLPKSMTSSRLS